MTAWPCEERHVSAAKHFIEDLLESHGDFLVDLHGLADFRDGWASAELNVEIWSRTPLEAWAADRSASTSVGRKHSPERLNVRNCRYRPLGKRTECSGPPI